MDPVKCLRCGRDNPPTAKYCRYCGFSLESRTGSSAERQNPIQDEIRQLRELVNQINFRLNVLENKQTPAQEIPALPKEKPSEVISSPPKTEIPAQISPELAGVTVTPEQPAMLLPGIKEQITKQAKPIPVASEPKVKKPREWEQILGGNWLARIGILALIIGMGFFLKFAIDKNWIGPSARVIIGVIVGLVLVSLGYYWRKRYPIMTQVLSGGGIAILYLSIFAAFATFHLINIYIAVLLLLIISGISTLLAMRYESMALAIIGIIGAFFAPFILGIFGERGGGGGSNQAFSLMAYIIAVDIGVLALSTFRNWRWFTLLAMGCSLLTYGFWYSEFHKTLSTGSTEIAITAIFIIFTGATSIFHIIRRRIPVIMDYVLVLVNAAAYTGISLALMWDEYRAWMGGFLLLLALFYGLLSYLTYKRNREDTGLSRILLTIALVLITIAIPVQFRNHATTTIAWAIEGLVLMWISFRKNVFALRYFSYIVFAAMTIKLLGFDTWLGGDFFKPVFNERFLAFIVSIAFTWLATFLLWKNRDKFDSVPYTVFLFAADFLTLWIIGAEILHYSQHNYIYAASTVYSLLIFLMLAAATIINLVIWRRKPTIIDIILTVLNAVAFTIISVFIWHDLRGWMGTAYLLLAICYGVLTDHIERKTENRGIISKFSLVITMVFLTLAVPVQFRDHAPTTIAWAIEMAALVWLSFKLKLPYMRYFSYAVFIAMVWRMLIFDTTIVITDFKPVLNERFLAYILGIAAIYFAIYLLWRRRDILKEWKFTGTFLLIVSSFLTLWLVSFEVWDTYSVAMRSAASRAGKFGLSNAQNLSLTAVWAVYAVAGLIVGIRKHWRYVRIGALALLVVPIGKVFIYDVFKLDTGYRIGAFVGLGVLLLASAYLYQRYSKIIKGVFTNK